MTPDDAWRDYLDDRSITHRNRLATLYWPMVRLIASKMVKRLHAAADVEELESFGSIGLLDAISRFDPARGILFRTYADRRIRGSIMDGIRDELAPIKRTASRRMKKRTEAIERYVTEHEHEPTYDELVKIVGKKVADERATSFHSLDTDIAEEKRTVTFASTIVDDNSRDPAQGAEDREVFDVVNRRLRFQYRDVINSIYRQHKTPTEIARQNGEKPGAVFIRHHLALRMAGAAMEGKPCQLADVRPRGVAA